MKRLIKLRVGIAIAYVLVMFPLMGGMIGYLYHVNSQLMIDTAAEEMEQATQSVRKDFQSMLDPVRQAVSSSAELLRTDVRRISQVNNLGYFHSQLDALPQIFSIYAGFDGSGDFYQIFHIPQSLLELGPWRKELSQDVRYAVRFIEDYPRGREDNFIFYKNWGEIAQVDRMPAHYDPRLRPWYLKSSNCSEPVFSDAYVFSSSKLIGITVSQRMTTSSGFLLGVVGADVTLDTLSDFLRMAQIGDKGRVFILDDQGRLVGHPDPKMGIEFQGDTVRLLPAVDVQDKVTAEAARQWQEQTKDHFEFVSPSTQQTYMATFSKMPIGNGQSWTIGVLVGKDELVGPIKAASLQIFIVGFIAITLATLAVVKLSKSLTDPIQAIVGQTDRLRKFDLEGDLDNTSRIREIHQLTSAVQTMTRSLRSFSVYVPRELVRTIVSGQEETALESRRQPITVVMTDIAGYTKATEDKPPEQVVELLNLYFEEMTQVIHSHRGIVDKYIGDAIMAIWNAPIMDPRHIQNACRAILECQEKCDLLAQAFKEKGEVPYLTRFGLHTGDAVIGNVGSSDRMQYSAIGEMVNLTSRLENLNKAYGTHILVSEMVANEIVPEFVVRMVDCVVPVGLSKSIMIYELLGERQVLEARGEFEAIQEKCDAWYVALQPYFDGQWFAAMDSFAAYQAKYPEDTLPEVFVKRCMAYQLSPPPEDWDGAQILLEK